MLLINDVSTQNSSYYSWKVGSSSDYKLKDESLLTGGIFLAGGSTDQDSAMKWFLKKALGGDVIVIREGDNTTDLSDWPTVDAYNDYLYKDLDVEVNSVETIFLNSKNVGNNLEVVEKVKNAEAIFFTGIVFKLILKSNVYIFLNIKIFI